MLTISHNLLAMNAQNKLNVNVSKRAKSTEKLSSGYRINRAADDAAGLAISEKMRRQIRGLNQGTENAMDGVSWSQIGDGALEEAQDILHRMTELTIKSLNETNTEEDRAYMEMEFEALQSELDRIGKTTRFNEQPIFEEHEIPYYQCEGDVKWNPTQFHVVTDGQNDLTFKYRIEETGAQEEVTITVPAGEYTTQELVDEIDTAIENQKLDRGRLVLEYTPDGYCHANMEGGEVLDSVSGGLSYLLYDMYKGGGYGALIGTTSFPNEYSSLSVVSGQNDFMSFTIEDFAGGSQTKNITIAAGNYTRSQMIDYLNAQLADTTVKATAYGTGIKLASDEAIVTGFKGNMFKIDGGGTIYNSVFYDNVKYGSATKTAAYFNGGYVLPTDSRDEEHRYFTIDSTNNQLVLQPNDMSSSVTLTIPDGKYTAEQMKNQLNTLFAAQGLALTASKISSGGFEGLRIESTIKGLDSRINMDSSSSAYNTLFVNREYNQYGTKAVIRNETAADKEATFTGSKDLSGLSTSPLTVTAGVNDSFKLSLNGTEYTITLSAKTYSSAAEVAAELNNQLNGAAALSGYKDRVSVSVSGNKIMLTGNPGQYVDRIRVTANGGNAGFDSIFQGYRIQSTTQNVSGRDSVTLNTPFDGNIDPSEKNMSITVDGTKYNVTLPTGAVTQDQIKNAIETAIPPRTVETPKTFSKATGTGLDGNHNFSITARGTTTVTPWSGSATGDSKSQEGVVGTTDNVPAKLTLGPRLNSSMSVDASNNQLTLTLNGVSKTISLDNGVYSPGSLKDTLQSKIDEAFGTGMGGALVEISGNQLALTSRLPQGADGKATSISCSTSNSSFLQELNTTRTAAVWTSTNSLASSMVIDDSNRIFQFQYKENGTVQTVSLTLNKGTYSQTSMVQEINNRLADEGINVTASLSSGKLVLTSGAVGNTTVIYYNTTTGGSSAETLFGPLSTPSEASIIVDLKTEDSIQIEAGSSDQFSIYVNGGKKTVTLDAGTYDRAGFTAMLNQKLSAAGAGVTAFVTGNKLGYRTTAVGSGASVTMDYANGGNSMKAIYGVTTQEYSGVKVDFTSDGRMKLETTKAGSTISVSSASGGAFQQPSITTVPISVSYTNGYHSNSRSSVDGVSLNGPVTIDEWNNNLKFTFLNNGVSQTVEIEVLDGVYSYADLQTKLQELLDAQIGSGKIGATVNSTGVSLESLHSGSQYRFSNFSGDFYDKVMCACTERSIAQGVKSVDGTQTVDSAYTIGRKDVRNSTSEIRRGINDELSLDFTYGGVAHKLSVKLDAGEYNGEALKKHLQEKLNEQLKAIGLEENLIEVGIGGINTGVFGSNDQNALNFVLSKTVKVPAEGQFLIDGVSGNAAFEIFYQTEGKMIPAYIMGTKDISQGVDLKAGENDLTVKVDGTEYPITLPEGSYTAEELLDAVNDAFDAAGAPLSAQMDDGRMKISHRKMGEHDIQEVSGGARNDIFFRENGKKGTQERPYVQLSSESGDHILLDKNIYTTANLRINSCCISRPKYAEKAIGRIKQALQITSEIRSSFGSTQNRLEHAINNNENKAENTQAAESLIRDTDMASEMVRLAGRNILIQAGQAMLAQANQTPQGVLALLRV